MTVDIGDSLKRALSDSAFDFQRAVWPRVRELPSVGGGELRPVESTSIAGFADDLDVLAGIDAWQIVRSAPMLRGLASRVQWGRSYRTFTIRYSRQSGAPTEYEKRLLAIRNKGNGYLFPHLTSQAYLDTRGGDVISAAVVKTEALIAQAALLEEHGVLSHARPGLYEFKQMDDSTFLYLSWKYLIHKNILLPADVYERPE